MSCQTAGTLRNLFLHTAVGNIGIDRLIHDIAQTRFQKLGGDSSPHSIGMSLSQRTRSVFDTAHDIYFGVPRRRAVPLAEPAQFFHREFSGESQYRVEHRRHVPGVEEKTIATFPTRIFGVIYQILREKYIYKIGSPHRTSGVSRVGFLYHRSSQNAYIVGCKIRYFIIHQIFVLIFSAYTKSSFSVNAPKLRYFSYIF